MKLKFSILLIVGLFMTVFVLNGCIFDSAQNINNDNTEVEVPDLEDEFGGYRPTNEAPGFGDPEILAEFVEDQDVVDLLDTDPQIAEAMEDSLVEVYFLRITWGNLEWDTTATAVMDWSGKAQIDKGSLVLLRTIRFEPADRIHRPRPNRQTLEWTSYTRPHFDGIYIAIVVLPSDTSSAEGSLTFSTTPFSRTFNYSELDSINVIYSVDEEGNEIAFRGCKKELVPCGNGFLEGRWIRTARHKGVFKGRWITRDGSLAGHFMGHWGIRRNGQKVFFGKCISHNGEFRWLIRARWEYAHWQGENRGWFVGEWFDRNRVARGVLKGHFRVGGQMGRKGFFEGGWEQYCPYGSPQ
jgi:hypothetical protein